MKTFEHGGNIHRFLRDNGSGKGEVIDFSANMNPIGPPEWLRSVVSSSLDLVVHYPDPDNSEFVQAVSENLNIDAECVIAANGTTELLYVLARVLPVSGALIPVPSYVDYIKASELAGLAVRTLQMREEDHFNLSFDRLEEEIRPGELVILGTPNNPTGILPDRERVKQLCQQFPDTFFVLDEAFLDFMGEDLSLAGTAANIITLHSMTKFYGVPGLRLGFGVFPVGIVKEVRKNIPPWTVNTFAQKVGARALSDRDYQQKSREICHRLSKDLQKKLRLFPGLKLCGAGANFIFMKLTHGRRSSELAGFCEKNNLLIRPCDNYKGLDDSYFRIAVRTAGENDRLLRVFELFFSPGRKKKARVNKSRSIMFQGTCSDAGKSILTAGLCRILRQDGFSVAPFKAQNMSLNSFVTMKGDEMGRAQVVQAQAAGIDPDCRMNPVLLKPNSDTGSQIIVAGQPVGNMSVLEYNSYKPECWATVCDCYDSLAREYDVIVLEGAGSPGEVNLKADDIVNMKMAHYAQSPVLLVGDIDRGGVYASFVGIMEVLAQWERRLVAGFIVNKFRGQASLLASAHTYVREHTGREVFGVIPYLSHLGLPEEDSVSFKKGLFNREKDGGESVEIVLLNLPHISNFTDVEPFLDEPDVHLRVVDRAADVGKPEAIILPGSKNVIHDLEFMRSEGFFEIIRRADEDGCEIVGICGGYMMLGRLISDPFQIESTAGKVDGLGLLPLETTIEKEKNLIRKRGVHNPSGCAVSGYEIHHGISTEAERPLISFEDSSACGTSSLGDRIWGCYLHGVFDEDEFRRWFIDRLRQRKGLKPVGRILAPYDLESSFDRLADCLRENLDIDGIYRLLSL
ncbi:cobyric acid synthase [Desulfomarina sp.]